MYMRKSLMFLSICIVLLGGIFFTACGENVQDTKLTLDKNEITIILDETSTSSENVDNAVIVSLNRSISDASIWVSKENENIANVEFVETIAGTNMKYKVTGLSVGTTEITFNCVENGAKAVLKVNVVEQISSLSFINTLGIYIAKGDTYTLKANKDIEIKPSNTLSSQLRYKLDENELGLKVDEVTGKIDASEVQFTGSVKLTAYVESKPEIKAETTVTIIEGVDKAKNVQVRDTDGNYVYSNGEQKSKIELVKSTTQSSTLLSILVTNISSDNIVYSSKVEGTSVEAHVTGGEIYLQAVSVGVSKVYIYLVPKLGIDYIEPEEICLEVNVIDLPNSILLNGARIGEDTTLSVYDYYDEGFIGTPISLQTYPSANEILADDRIIVDIQASNINQIFKLFEMVNGSPVEIPLDNGSFEVKSGAELYIQAKSIDDLSETTYNVKLQSTKALEYGLDISAEIKLELKKGIQELIIPNEIRLKLHETQKHTFDVLPINADTSGVEIRTSSKNITVARTGASEFSVTANAVSDEEFITFVKPNGVETTCRVVIYEELKELNVDIDSISSGLVSDKAYDDNGRVISASVKTNKEINIYYSSNEGATITNVSIKSDKTTGISINEKRNTFICLGADTYKITITMTGFDSEGIIKEITHTFVVTSYKAITSVTINKTNAVCYTANSVGYYNVNDRSVVYLAVQVNPNDAKFANSVEWTITDEFGNPSSIGTLTNNRGLSTSFSVNSLESDQTYVIVTATIQQFGEIFSVSCKIRVVNAVQVDQIVVNNVPNQNLYFDSRKGLDESNSYKVQCSVYPTNALNRNLRYMYRTMDDKTSDDPIFSVDSKGVITPIKSGKAKLYICAEDSFTSSLEASKYIVIYVTVQDGKSLETAFHIEDANDLLAIQDSEESMSYYYIITKNIDMSLVQNFKPIGYDNEWAFTGYITGKNVYNYGDSYITNYYSISNISLYHEADNKMYDKPSRKNGIGLFYGLDKLKDRYDGAPEVGTVQDLTISYSRFEVDLSKFTDYNSELGYFIYYIGGVAGSAFGDVNSSSILNVKVYFNNFMYRPGKHIAYIGGQVGYVENALLEYNEDCKGVLVRGSDIIVYDNDLNSRYYIGGLVGYNKGGVLQSRYLGMQNSEQEIIYSTLFGNENIDVTINVCDNYLGESYRDSIKSTESVVGGIVGYNEKGTIKNVATENTIYGKNNIGGIVGITKGGNIENCFSSSRLRGENYIGGIVGKTNNASESEKTTISQSYAQNYDDATSISQDMPMIIGVDYLGGIVGLGEHISIDTSYSASYISDRTLGSESSSEQYMGDIYSSQNAGNIAGFIGYASNAQISKCYSNYVAYFADQSANVKLVGSSTNVNVTHCYIESIINANLNVSIADGAQVSSSYQLEKNSDGTYTFNVTGVTNNTNSYDVNAISEVQSSWFVDFSSDIWQIEDRKSPFIKLGENGYNMVELAPESIEALSAENASSILQKVTIEDEEQSILLLEYYKSSNSLQQSLVDKLNQTYISSYITMQSSPTDGYAKRYIVESENKDVLSIGSDGSFIINGLGETRVKIASRLNAKKFVYIYVSIVYATDGMRFYETATNHTNNLSEISIYLNQLKQIFPTLSSSVHIEDEDVELQVENRAKLEYEFYHEDADFNVNEYLIVSDMEDNGSNVIDVEYSKPQSIYGKKEKYGISMSVKPYIEVLGQKIYFENAFNASYNVQNVSIEVLLGATAISVVDAKELLVEAGEQAISTVRVDTTASNEYINISIYDENNALVDTFSSGTDLNNTKVFNVQVVTTTNIDLGYIDFTIYMSYKPSMRFITETQNYTVKISTSTNYSINATLDVSFYPAEINRIENKFYTYSFLKGNENEYNKNEYASDMILPGTAGLLVFDIFPNYADYDYIDVTYSSPLTFNQMIYNESTSGYPYEKYGDVSYLSKGIRLANVYYDDGNIKQGKKGRYYVSVLAQSDTLQSKYVINVSAYKTRNGVVEKVFSNDITLTCMNLPVIDVSYKGESSDKVQEIFVPVGIIDNLDVAIYNSDREPNIYVRRVGDDVNIYPYVSVYKDGSKYKLDINKNATIGDNIRITFECSKTIGDITHTVTKYIDIIIVAYQILDLGFDYVESNTLREVFGGSYKLALSFEKSKFFYDTENKEIEEIIKKDLEKLNAYDFNTWYAYREEQNSADSPLGAYYVNDYLEIKTKSSMSKDLYVSGKFYDEIQTNQKILGAYIKYYFDKSTNSWTFSKSLKNTANRKSTNPYEFYSIKEINNGRYYYEQSKFFNVSFYMNTSMKNAKPIYNVSEFQNMEPGISYILMRDLELVDFTPITNAISYLNGNNKTVTVTSFKNNNKSEQTIGIFETVSPNTIIENLKVNISANCLKVNAENKSNVTFGMLAGVNKGKIYNCSVTYTGAGKAQNADTRVTTTKNGELVTGTQDYLNASRDAGDNTSGNVIGSVTGLAVQISVVNVGESFVTSTMGVLVGQNAGYITSCRVEEGLTFHGYGIIGGLVGSNTGTIASSYSKAKVYSYTTVEDYSSIGGFVGVNSGTITLSFVEVYAPTGSTSTGINAVCKAGGFVYQNSSNINNCYSNLIVTSNSSTAGFVYDNLNGYIQNCYSSSRVREDSKRDMAFVGVDAYNNINNQDGRIVDCYFMKGNYANQELQPAHMLNKSDFAETSSFATFAFGKSDKADSNGLTTSGVWMMPKSGGSDRIYGTGDYTGQTFIPNQPTLVAPNLVSKGYVEFLSSGVDDDGNPIYNYSALIGADLGHQSHPYVVYSAEDLNKYIAEARNSDYENNKVYVLASNITFEGSTRMAETYYTDFSGKIEGNGMTIESLRLSYLYDEEKGGLDEKNFGLFKTLDGATIQNLDIQVEEVYGSVVERVGVLAGTVTNSQVYNIGLYGEAVVQGKNLVGGLIGFAGSGNQISDIYSEINVNATYRTTKNTIKKENDSYKELSFGGGIIGFTESTQDVSSLNALSIGKQTKVLGEVVGGLVGSLDKGMTLANSRVLVNSDMYIKGVHIVGGLVGVNYGEIKYSYLEYESKLQTQLDDVSSVINKGQKENVGSINTIAFNDFYQITIDSSTTNKAGAIGGLVGVNYNGSIGSSYNKVNIVSNKARIIGGLVGLDYVGNIELSYSTAVLDMGNRLIDSRERVIGGLVGVESASLFTDRYGLSEITGKDLIIKNSASISTYNLDNNKTYDYIDENEAEQTYMNVGGVLGAIEDGMSVSFDSVSYNSEILANNVADLSTSDDKKINGVGIKITNNTVDFSVNPSAILGSNDSLQANTKGYMYVQMVSDGKKVYDETGDFYTYEPLGEVDGKKIYGQKTDIYSAFVIESYFEFNEDASAYPNIKAVQRISSLDEIFVTDGYMVYLQGSDLQKLSIISNSSLGEWTKFDGFRNYIFVLQSDISLSSDWKGLFSKSTIPFRGTIDGNGKTINGLTLNANNKGFVINASGATIKSVKFDDITFDTNSCKGNFGLISSGTNVTFDSVSAYYTNAIADNENVTFGGLVGYLKGTYNAINKSYTTYESILGLTSKAGTFIGEGESANVSINVSYSANTASETQNVPMIDSIKTVNVQDVLVHTNKAEKSKVTNSGTISGNKHMLSSTSSGANIYPYNSDKKQMREIFTTQSNWSSNVWENSLWDRSGSFPVHNWDKNNNIIFDGIGEYNEADRSYTITNSIQLSNLAEMINNGTMQNGGDSYTFRLAHDLDGNYFAIYEEKEYYIYTNEDSTNYIIYDGVHTSFEMNEDKDDGSFKIVVDGKEQICKTTVVNKPIQSIGSADYPFRGTFDGNGKTISDITFEANINHNNVAYGGVFGKVKDGIIKDVTLSNITIEIPEDSTDKISIYYVGGVAGALISGTISNVIGAQGTNNIKFTNAENISIDTLNLGSVIGYGELVTLKDTKVSTNNDLNGTNANIGAIVGYLIRNNTYISNCGGSDTNRVFGYEVTTTQDVFTHADNVMGYK